MFEDLVKSGEGCCGQLGCYEKVRTCPEIRGNNAAVVYCLRAQGWCKAKTGKHIYCPQHLTQIAEHFGEGWNHEACLKRHTEIATASASTASLLEQCCDKLCRAGYQVCCVCKSRMIPWTAGAHEFTPLAEHTLELMDKLNCLPANMFPSQFICDMTDESLKQLGAHDSQAGRGDDREADPGNAAGSALLLAALLPRVYGIETAGPLRIFGVPPPQCLTHICSTRAKSGKKADNRRQNVWEAMLNHWQGNTSMQELRDLLAVTLFQMHCAIDQVDPEGTKLVWELPRPALVCSVMHRISHRERRLHGHMA